MSSASLVRTVGERDADRTTDDDVTIPDGTGAWEIGVMDVDRIDNFTIQEHVNFVSAGGSPTLKVNTLTIEAPAGSRSVTISGATITTGD
ncbi:MAG: hypothetical protein KKB50_00665 [Planctomycetes bacterium]|nr:hypothetical protein [Planctomycetota bacterium]